MSFKEMTWVI